MKKYIKPETETIKMEGQAVLSVTSISLYGTNSNATQASKRNLNDDWDEDWDDEDW